MIEQGRIDTVKSELISNSVQALNQLDGGLPAGSFYFVIMASARSRELDVMMEDAL